MPARDYECTKCGHEFEENTKDPLKTCPQCKKKSLQTVFLKAPRYMSRYSPMHPNVNRGRGY